MEIFINTFKSLLNIVKPILEVPLIYLTYQNLMGDTAFRKKYVLEHIMPKSNDKILDIGCGPGNMVKFLPVDINYMGFDKSTKYTEYAAKKFSSSNFKFITSELNDTYIDRCQYDIVMANAVLMNLDDNEANQLFETSYKALKQGGRLVLYDGYYNANLPFIEKFLVTNERGNFLRTKDEYQKLATKHFKTINLVTLDNMYRIPYPMIIIECTK